MLRRMATKTTRIHGLSPPAARLAATRPVRLPTTVSKSAPSRIASYVPARAPSSETCSQSRPASTSASALVRLSSVALELNPTSIPRALASRTMSSRYGESSGAPRSSLVRCRLASSRYRSSSVSSAAWIPWVAIPAPVPRLGRLNRACSGYRDPVPVEELFAAVLDGADVRLDAVRTGRQVHRHGGLAPVRGGRVQF